MNPNVSTSNLSIVGSYGSQSFYGTYDQGGNAREWVDFTYTPGGDKMQRGGDITGNYTLSGNEYSLNSPQDANWYKGFRLATIPEPTSVALLGLTALLAAIGFRRYSK